MRAHFSGCLGPQRWLAAPALFLVLMLMSSVVSARRGDPPLTTLGQGKLLAFVESLAVPAADADALGQEDARVQATGSKVLRVGVPREVSVTTWSAGTWETFDDLRLWRLRVHAPGATDLTLGFTDFRVPAGTKLYVVSETRDYYEGPYTEEDNETHGELWIPPVPGDRVVIELQIPVRPEFVPEIEFTQVYYGYRDVLKITTERRKQGSCNVDVACPEADLWRAEVASVAWYWVNGSLCSGQLIMDAQGSFRPLFLSAYHCGLQESNAAAMIVFWNEESPNCGDLCCGTYTHSQSGATFLARRQDVDFALVELDDPVDPEVGAYWAGWDRSGVTPNGVVAIHQPGTEEKAIGFEFDPLGVTGNCAGPATVDTHWLVNDWDVGTTEPGSSGSGIWDPETHKLVGYLSGGLAACGNDLWDCYGNFSLAWHGPTADSRLRDWLATPFNPPMSVAGSFPYGASELRVSSHAGIDACGAAGGGDANGLWEPGEEIDVSVDLVGVGDLSTGITGTLSSFSKGVIIVNGATSWPDIDNGSVAGSTAPFRIRLDPIAPCLSNIELNLSVNSAESLAHPTLTFTHPVGRTLPSPEVPKEIPRAYRPTVSSMEVQEDLTLADLNVRVSIHHSAVGALTVELIAPSGATVTLLDHPQNTGFNPPRNCSDENMEVVFDDEATFGLGEHCTGTNPWYEGVALPLLPLSLLDGTSTLGTWSLRVTDSEVGVGFGEVLDWELLPDPPFSTVCQTCEEGPATITATTPVEAGAWLGSNRPNPFNPRTVIPFRAAVEGHVSLVVYDAAGRRVKTLIDRVLPAGQHDAIWNGTDTKGKGVASGVYFYRLSSPGYSQVLRMTLVR